MSKAAQGAGEAEATQPTTPSLEDDSLSRDEIFEVLSNRRRRYALHSLQQDQDNRAELGEMSKQIAAWETNQSHANVSPQERKRVYTSLQQFHLPKMDEKGIVRFDTGDGVVELDEAAEDLDIYLEVTDGYDLPWSAYYLGLAGISAVLVALSWAGIAPFASIPNEGWVVFVITTLTLFAAAHTVVTHFMRLGCDGEPPE